MKKLFDAFIVLAILFSVALGVFNIVRGINLALHGKFVFGIGLTVVQLVVFYFMFYGLYNVTKRGA